MSADTPNDDDDLEWSDELVRTELGTILDERIADDASRHRVPFADHRIQRSWCTRRRRALTRRVQSNHWVAVIHGPRRRSRGTPANRHFTTTLEHPRFRDLPV
jgi:hypothetical protein